jgi:hypothetical protein
MSIFPLCIAIPQCNEIDLMLYAALKGECRPNDPQTPNSKPKNPIKRL